MSNVDDVWASMREEAEKNLQTQKIRMKKRIEVTEKHSEKKGGRVKASAGQSVDDIVAAAEAKEKKEKLKAKKEMKEAHDDGQLKTYFFGLSEDLQEQLREYANELRQASK